MSATIAAISASLTVALLAVACTGSEPPPVVAAGSRPECPHGWDSAFKALPHVQHGAGEMEAWTTTGTPQEFLISRAITNIPEYHDCQRLIPNAAGEHAYGGLAAVFARDQLDTLVPSLEPRPGERPGVRRSSARPGRPTGTTRPALPEPRLPRTLAVAEIVSEGVYESLGIGVGFNCLLLDYAANDISARMVALGTDHTTFDCVSLEHDPMPQGAAVQGLQVMSADFEHVPPAARWEWDTESNRQLLGVKCARQRWCVIGPEGPLHPILSRGLAGAPRGMTAPGWYDEQWLAEPLTDGSAPGTPQTTLTPSGPFATIFPDAALDVFRSDDYPRNRWITAAYIALPKDSPVYRSKLGLQRTSVLFPSSSPVGLNQLQFCVGTLEQCDVRRTDINDPGASGCTATYIEYLTTTTANAGKLPVWARIIPPGASGGSLEVRYHCVTHREHPGVFIPSVVRWRWQSDDETIWGYCPSGCCEVHSSPM